MTAHRVNTAKFCLGPLRSAGTASNAISDTCINACADDGCLPAPKRCAWLSPGAHGHGAPCRHGQHKSTHGEMLNTVHTAACASHSICALGILSLINFLCAFGCTHADAGVVTVSMMAIMRVQWGGLVVHVEQCESRLGLMHAMLCAHAVYGPVAACVAPTCAHCIAHCASNIAPAATTAP
jgi:hypothetical protein